MRPMAVAYVVVYVGVYDKDSESKKSLAQAAGRASESALYRLVCGWERRECTETATDRARASTVHLRP